jgi:tripartite-type tricarboxylate transporter receptor subunit TctC
MATGWTPLIAATATYVQASQENPATMFRSAPPVALHVALAVASLLAVCSSQPALAQAQTYPDRQIRIIVPFPAGGGSDVVARTVANGLTTQLGQSVIVDNRPGGQTIIGSQVVASASPDGYTLLSCTADQTAINVAFGLKLPYDPVKSFANISGIGAASLVLLASKKSGLTSVADLVAKAMAEPGKLSFGSLGPSSPHFLLFTLFKQLAGIDVVDVPYRGTAQAATDLIGGQIDLVLIGGTTANGFASEGKATLLATTGATRNAFAPAAPTLAESGYPTMVYYSRFGLCGPAGMPGDIVAKLDSEVQRALKDPGAARTLSAVGLEPWIASPAEFDRATQELTDTFFKVIKANGIRPPEGQ